MYPAQETGREISLIDLWLVLARRRNWFLVTFVVSVVAAVATAFFMPPRFESRAVLSLGQVKGIGLLEQPDVMLERLKRMYKLGRGDRRTAPPYMENIELNSTAASANLLTFVAVGLSPEEARDFLQKAVGSLVVVHTQLYDEALQVQRERLSILNAALAQNRQQADALKRRLDDLKSLTSSAAPLLALEYAKIVESEPLLKMKELDLRLALMPPGTQPTQLLLKPIVSEYPLQPRPALYIGVGIIAGVLLGVFAVIAVEFLATARRGLAVRRRPSQVS